LAYCWVNFKGRFKINPIKINTQNNRGNRNSILNEYNPKIHQIHHRQSIRLKDYDYSTDGCYFVTICIKDKIKCFGEIIDSEMVLNEYRKIVNQYWLEIPEYFPNAKLDECIIMPNHLHEILIVEDDIVVGNRHACSLHNMGNKRQYQKLPAMGI